MSNEAQAPPAKTRWQDQVLPGVFYPALAFLSLVVFLSIVFTEETGDVLSSAQENVIGGIGWYYTLAVSGFVIFALWVGLGRFGDLVLGDDDRDPEFSLRAWFAMLFAAGMGIGLVFWGAAEPLTFFTNPKPGVEGSEGELAQQAMTQVFLHWGFHAWAIYVVVGLAMAWAIHRKGHGVSLRWALEPLFGDRVKGRLGDVIDVVAIVGTVAGVATSLGLGVAQIGAGLEHLGVIGESTTTFQIILIMAITALATISVVTGLAKGIKWLSNINLVLAGVFVLLLLALGPTLFLLRDFVQNLGSYAASIVPMSFDTSALAGQAGVDWQSAWTTFYWGWWISWAPFVGIFIARISRGRTVREFVAGVLIVPTLVSAAWFTVLGGSAIIRQMDEGDLVGEDGSIVSEDVLFNLLDSLPASGLLSGIAIILVTIFFITSSDSGSLVVDMLASGGDPEPPTWSRVLWALVEGSVAIALLLAGGLGALQTGAILTAAPFSLIMIAMAYATYRELSHEHREIQRLNRKARQRELVREVGGDVTEDLVDNFDDHFGEPVDTRINVALEDRFKHDGPSSAR